jgi:hypothetical protein
MYHLEIIAPVGRRILEWDPDKLRQRDPSTMKTVADADKLFKEALAYNASLDDADSATGPKMAVVGRWLSN